MGNTIIANQDQQGNTYKYQVGNRCLTVDNPGTRGSHLSLQECSNNNGQVFLRNNATLVNNGQCLAAPQSRTATGTNAIVWDCNNGPEQNFGFNQNRINSAINQNQCLSASNNGLVFAPCGQDSNQSIIPVPIIAPVPTPGAALSVYNRCLIPSNNQVELRTCNVGNFNNALRYNNANGTIYSDDACLTSDNNTFTMSPCSNDSNQQFNQVGSSLSNDGTNCLFFSNNQEGQSMSYASCADIGLGGSFTGI